MQIAEHFGWDVADVRDYHYQPGTFSKRVYAGMDGNMYWSAGKLPPRERGVLHQTMVWRRVESNYPGNGVLWVASSDE